MVSAVKVLGHEEISSQLDHLDYLLTFVKHGLCIKQLYGALKYVLEPT